MSRTRRNRKRQRLRRSGKRMCHAIFDAAAGACRSGKRCYQNEGEAHLMLRLIQHERSQHQRHEQMLLKVERRAYHCRHCGHWHLTSQGPKP